MKFNSRIEYSQPIGVTQEANTVSINFSNAVSAYVGTSIFISKKIEEQEFKEFIQLKDKWKEETLFSSSGTEIISNSAYKKIISMGKPALPWIFRELKKSNDHWFYALEKITGENPISIEHIGIIEKMKEDWISWADKNNL